MCDGCDNGISAGRGSPGQPRSRRASTMPQHLRSGARLSSSAWRHRSTDREGSMIVSKPSPAFQQQAAMLRLARFAESSSEKIRREPLSRILSTWRLRRQYRQELQRLMKVGPHMIADIGLKLEDARIETVKPFWQR